MITVWHISNVNIEKVKNTLPNICYCVALAHVLILFFHAEADIVPDLLLLLYLSKNEPPVLIKLFLKMIN